MISAKSLDWLSAPPRLRANPISYAAGPSISRTGSTLRHDPSAPRSAPATPRRSPGPARPDAVADAYPALAILNRLENGADIVLGDRR